MESIVFPLSLNFIKPESIIIILIIIITITAIVIIIATIESNNKACWIISKLIIFINSELIVEKKIIIIPAEFEIINLVEVRPVIVIAIIAYYLQFLLRIRNTTLFEVSNIVAYLIRTNFGFKYYY